MSCSDAQHRGENRSQIIERARREGTGIDYLEDEQVENRDGYSRPCSEYQKTGKDWHLPDLIDEEWGVRCRDFYQEIENEG